MPAAVVAAMSSAKALAVTATMGTSRASGRCRARMRRAASQPSITGICMSMRMGVEGEGLRFAEALHGLRAVPRLRDLKADAALDCGGDLHVDFVVLGQQYAPALEGEALVRLRLRVLRALLPVDNGEGQDDGKGRALAGGAFDMDLAVHLRDDALRDGACPAPCLPPAARQSASRGCTARTGEEDTPGTCRCPVSAMTRRYLHNWPGAASICVTVTRMLSPSRVNLTALESRLFIT